MGLPTPNRPSPRSCSKTRESACGDAMASTVGRAGCELCAAAARIPIIEPLTDSLSQALARASSRLAPPRTPAISMAIHLAVLLLWLALFGLAFGYGGILAWSVGLAYLAYDAALQVFIGWQISRKALAANISSDRTTHPSVAVLIAARNEATALPATLAALLGQDDPPDEIVIADDGSGDRTAEVLRTQYALVAPSTPVLHAKTTMLWLQLAHGGKARALNAALTAARCDVILTVDADTVLDAGAIAAVRQAFSNAPELVGVTGVITPVCAPTPGGRVLQWFQTYEYIRNFLGRYAWMQLNCLQLISGAFAGFRGTALVAVGGFDDACLVEDYELVARMQRFAGERGLTWRFQVLGTAQAHTEAPGTIAGFLRQRRRWFGGFLQTQWWYRAMVGDRRLGKLGTVMLPIKALDAVQPLYGLTALALLGYFIADGRIDILGPVLLVVVGRIVIDIAFSIWSLRCYRRWVGDPHRASLAGIAASTVFSVLTFQLLLLAGAALGWLAFLSGSQRWGSQRRFGMAAPRSSQ
jgi:cellulose synthase/poly-beta-1,6-N-acetylglucosamine synthase-like glycosyltransferase